MDRIDKILNIYKRVMLVLLVLSILSVFIMGYYIAGPFVESSKYIWLNTQMDKTPIIRDLINVGDMIVDALVRASFPMFALWSVVFFVYPYFKESTESLNKFIKIASIFSKGPSSILLLIGGGILSFSLYAYQSGATNPAIGMALISLVMFLAPGAYFRYYSSLLVIENNKVMEKYSLLGGVITASLAVIGYFYSITIETIRMFLSIYNLYPGS